MSGLGMDLGSRGWDLRLGLSFGLGSRISSLGWALGSNLRSGSGSRSCPESVLGSGPGSGSGSGRALGRDMGPCLGSLYLAKLYLNAFGTIFSPY